MDSREAAPQRGSISARLAAAPARALDVPARPRAASALLWASIASTLYRVRRGEGALLAVNLSLVMAGGLSRPGALATIVVSTLTIVVMYALNDLYDAPADTKNPKKDQVLTATYVAHRRAGAFAVVAATAGILALAATTVEPGAVVAVALTMLCNVVYSVALKGVPVIDVAWCGLWGALYASIATPVPSLWLLVGLMTAVCHLYQALDDRAADAANAITTTAVRSSRLSTAVLATLGALLAAALRPTFGLPLALTAFTPLAIHVAGAEARSGWLLTKAYFAVMWLAVLGTTHAAG